MKTLHPSNLYPYQETGVKHILRLPHSMLWLDVGLGKTVICETAVNLLQATGDIQAALVLAPLRVCQLVWRQEAERWSHLQGMSFSLIHGTAGQRALALRRKADIYLMNYENLSWLSRYLFAQYISKRRDLPFDMIVYDEVTKLKTSTSQRSKAVNDPQHTATYSGLWPYFKRHVGLTGEPAENGYIDLHGQYLAVDGGARLGKFVTHYRERYLCPTDLYGRSYTITKIGRELVHKRIRDITLEMSSRDYLDLPPVVENTIWVDLPPKARALYDEMEKRFFAELENGAEIEAQTEATKNLKCLQVAGGSVYKEDHTWEPVHDAKLDALEDLLEELNGEPLLLAYCFRHEAERIAKRFPAARFLSSQFSEREIQNTVDQWRNGSVPLLCGHPASIGHGLNLGAGSHLAWFGRNWSLGLTNQFNGRLTGGHRRQGRVTQHYILARDTLDIAVHDALTNKAGTQAQLKKAIRDYQHRR